MFHKTCFRMEGHTYHFKASYSKEFNNILTLNWFSFLWNRKSKIVCILLVVRVLSDIVIYTCTPRTCVFPAHIATQPSNIPPISHWFKKTMEDKKKKKKVVVTNVRVDKSAQDKKKLVNSCYDSHRSLVIVVLRHNYSIHLHLSH